MNPTDLDELKLAWRELSQKFDRQNALVFARLIEDKLTDFRSGLRPLIVGQVLQLVIGAIITGFAAEFWIAHIHKVPLLVSGLFLHAYGIMFIAFAVRDLALISGMEYSAPVLTIQKQLAQLRGWHIRAAVWYAMTSSVVWLPGMLIALHYLGGDMLFDKPHKYVWLVSSAVVCFAVNYALVFLARSSGRCGAALRNSWIGRTVNRAQETLDEIAQFEREAI